MTFKDLSLWVSALRSGDYGQVHGPYKTTSNCYCGLGLLHVVRGGKWSTRIFDTFKPMNDENEKTLCHDDWDMPSHLPTRIVNLNDHDKISFDELADYIELHKDEFLETPNED